MLLDLNKYFQIFKYYQMYEKTNRFTIYNVHYWSSTNQTALNISEQCRITCCSTEIPKSKVTNLPGKGRLMDRTANTPPLHLSWCSWAERGVPASHSGGILPPLRDKRGTVTMETTNIMGYFGTGNETKTYRHSLSCSSGAFVQEDTHTRNCPVCSHSHIHSSRY